MNPSGILLIVSGPAGIGKTTVCERLLEATSNLQRIITTTTRSARGNEKDGVDYHFIDRANFEAKIAGNEFYEYARVHNQLYGTQKSAVHEKLQRGTDLLLNIDVQGAAQMRKMAKTDPVLNGRLVTVFLMPPTLEELEKRLIGRGTDSAQEVQRRMQVAKIEIKQSIHYDSVLKSTNKEADFEKLRTIYTSEKLRLN